MGQYYKPVNLKTKEWVYSHDIKEKCTRPDGTSFMIGSGLKLMEHSWLKNPFVKAIESLLVPGGAWYKQPIVWAGDYADPEKGSDTNLYGMCTDKTKLTPKPLKVEHHFIVNHTKKQYVDKRKVPEVDGWAIHPLPILTCEGNGRGGGDLRKKSHFVGKWAGDSISIEKEMTNHGEGFISFGKQELLEGYKELIFDLVE